MAGPVKKEALLSEHVVAMLDALSPSDLRNLRDRAILLVGFAGGLRRSEIVGLVMSRQDSFESSGWPEFFDDGVLLTQRGKTGWREIEIGRGSSERTCPVAALETWLKFAHIARRAIFRAVLGARSDRSRSTTGTSHSSSSAWRSPPACAAIFPSASGRRNSAGTRCAPDSRRRPRSTNATSKSTSATLRRK
jgi:integrase